MRQSESQANLEKAIAASLENQGNPHGGGNAGMDEDEALARALAESMQWLQVIHDIVISMHKYFR